MDAPPLDLDELRRLEAEATPAPWRTHDTWLDLGGYTEVVIRSDKTVPWAVTWLPTRSGKPGDDQYRCAEDAALIAAMRNALPGLLTELERLGKENTALGVRVQQAWARTEAAEQEVERLRARPPAPTAGEVRTTIRRRDRPRGRPMSGYYEPGLRCNVCGKPTALTVLRRGVTGRDVVADRCADHSTGLRGAAEENRDGSWSIITAAEGARLHAASVALDEGSPSEIIDELRDKLARRDRTIGQLPVPPGTAVRVDEDQPPTRVVLFPEDDRSDSCG